MFFGETVSIQGKDFPLLGNSQKDVLETSPVIGKNNWRSNANPNPSLDKFQKIAPQISPEVGMSNWRLKACSPKPTPESLGVVEKNNRRPNATHLFGNYKKVTPESSPASGLNNWRSNLNRGKQ